ncbi:MAG: nucleotide sugar dehydrogenase [Caldisericum sp.]|jgi:UDP-N-acetyl-D-glucosamine dehydrogenase|uniref:nucleotide sugar dehydrogenase n=1 Tax=Caldisericum sp. TaxID=2499687 RepID=UPI003CB413C5
MKELSIIGGGFVGMNVAVLGAKYGLEVTVIDINPKIVGQINKGTPHIKERYILENWDKIKNKISATTDYSAIKNADYIVIAVQTLKNNDLDFTPLISVVNELTKYLQPYTLISSEVTIFPTGTEKLIVNPIKEKTGLQPDKELLVVHVPERLNPDDMVHNIETIPRILGGIGPNSTHQGFEFYAQTLKLHVTTVDDIRIAEAAKLLENAFRLINISFINELKQGFDKLGIDIRKVISAAATKPFGYMPFYPSPYAGGSCIPKDSLLLLKEINSQMLKYAIEINEKQPEYYAQKIIQIIRSQNAKKILFYGYGFKPNSKYAINSPILKIIHTLKNMSNYEIKKYDPQIPEYNDFVSEMEAIDWADLIFTWGNKPSTQKQTYSIEKL